MNNKEEFNLSDLSDIASEWRGVNWDKIQRMRFANIDCEIDPEDGYEFNKKQD